jgi:hypothetical protein
MAERRTRREFMGLATAGVVGAFAPSLRGATSSAFGATADRALHDLVVVSAKVYRMETALPRAKAFAVSNGRIVAAGASTQVPLSSAADFGAGDSGAAWIWDVPRALAYADVHSAR